MIEIRKHDIRDWSGESTKMHLESCSFEIKETGYLDKPGFIQDVEQALWMVLAPWWLPCILAENPLKSSGFVGGHTNTLDVSDGNSKRQIDID